MEQDYPSIDFLNDIPDEVVRNDVINTINKWQNNKEKFSEHSFNKFRRALNPYPFAHYRNKTSDRVEIYSGGLGHGNFIHIDYDFNLKKYIFYGSEGFSENNKFNLFESSSWDETYNFVTKYLIDNCSPNAFIYDDDNNQ